MHINHLSPAQKKIDSLYEDVIRRRGVASYGGCPVAMTASFVELCLAQSCGKCVPCRVGLAQLSTLLNRVLDGKATAADLESIERAAKSIYDSADCAIGFESAKLVLDGLEDFREDYLSHVEKGVCTERFAAVPCVAACPAHVDIPGYIALIRAGRYADAVRLIRKDNPFPSVCGLICEHPCEAHCRRTLVDAPVNIRGLKRYAAEQAGDVPVPACAPSNGKTVAVIGGGPAGLTAAYFLQLKGFAVTVYEKRPKLGGMLRYGIPRYRLPAADLDRDIESILSTGVEVKYGVNVGTDITFEQLRSQYDCVYISIGAHSASRLNCEGEDAEGVYSAVDFLGAMGEGKGIDVSGKRVVVVGGGNVAMDACRTALRLGAKSVTCVYRRRVADMTALPAEIEATMAEGCDMRQMMAPVRIETENGRVVGFVAHPQIPGAIKDGRPTPVNANAPDVTIPCEAVVVAVGQAIDSAHFAESGVSTRRNRVVADISARALGESSVLPGVFAGGDCCSGPATVVRAIDAGKVAASNIEAYCGLYTPLSCDIDIPQAAAALRLAWGRVDMQERPAQERKCDFEIAEIGMSDEEAAQECTRCLRCDHYGLGACKEGRLSKW